MAQEDKIKITRHKFEGDVIEGEYDVILNGTEIGRVVRHDGTPSGYWGRWSALGGGARRYYTDTRADAVGHLVRLAKDKVAADA